MRRSGRRGRGPAIVRAGRAHLAHAVRERGALRHVLGQRARGAGNVPDRPVQQVVGAAARHRVEIVDDQHETDGGLGRVRPAEGRRDVAAGLTVLRRNLAAVGPRRRAERHDLYRPTPSPALRRRHGRRHRRRRRGRILRNRRHQHENRDERQAPHLKSAGCVFRHSS